MFLYSAIVPPREILDEVWGAVRPPDVPAAPEPEDTPPRRRGARHRREPKSRRTILPLGSTTEDPPKPKANKHQQPLPLDLAPVAHCNLMLAKFGNLSLDDVARLTAAMTEAAEEWPSPRLRFRGYSTLESETDPSVWVDLEGDLEELRDVARGVPEVAKRLNLFVDRRVFQPRVRLGSVRPGINEFELELMLATLSHFETNAWWQTTFSLLTRTTAGPDEPDFKTWADVPLGPHVVH